MGLVSLALIIGVFCDFIYSILLVNAILWLDFLGLALFRQRETERLQSRTRRLYQQTTIRKEASPLRFHPKIS